MDFASSNILNDILVFFEKASVTGMLNLQPQAKYLVGVLAIIDLCSTWTLYDGEMRMSQMVSKVMKLGAFLFLIMYWADINQAIMVSFQHAGLIAANVPADHVIQPSKIISNGFEIVGKLLDGLPSVGLNFGKAIMYLITIALVLAAFFFMALQILLTKIEFNIFASIAVILLPFGAIRYTNFLCQRCISAVFAFGVKLMVMYFMLGLIQNVTETVQTIPENSFSDMLKQALTYVVMGFLIWKIPNLAAMMIQGTPALDISPGSIKQYSQQAASMPSKIANTAGRAYGAHRAALELARASVSQPAAGTASPAGRSLGMAYMREIYHQQLGNLAFNRGRYSAAQKVRHASQRHDRVSSGDYAKKTFHDHDSD